MGCLHLQERKAGACPQEEIAAAVHVGAFFEKEFPLRPAPGMPARGLVRALDLLGSRVAPQVPRGQVPPSVPAEQPGHVQVSLQHGDPAGHARRPEPARCSSRAASATPTPGASTPPKPARQETGNPSVVGGPA